MSSPRRKANRQVIAACLPRRMRGARELAPMEGRAEMPPVSTAEGSSPR
jgi:hypothetical protein